jgi:tetratricopeptide (TPR) repeat protein
LTSRLRATWPLLVIGLLAAPRVEAAPDEIQPSAAPPLESSRPVSGTASADADPDAARKAEAEALRQRALSDYDAGDYAAARREFERANAVLSSFHLLYNLGVVSMALADPASAHAYFERCLAKAGNDLPEERRLEIERQLQELAARTALLYITVSSSGALVLLDEQNVGVSPLAAPVRHNPGPVRVSARLPEGRNVSQTVNLAAGQTSRVDLDFTVPAPHFEARPVAPPEHQQRHVPWAGWAATAALTTGAVVAGLEALSAQHSYERPFESIGTTRAELDRLDTRTTRWSVAADTLTGAAIVVGAYSLYLMLRDAPVTPSANNASNKFSLQLQSQRASLGIRF